MKMPLSMTSAIFIAFLASILIPQTVLAWSATGHEAVCEIAFQELDPNAKAKVLEIMSHETDSRFMTFRDSCVWPDYMGPQRSRHKEHYINVPRYWYYIKYENCVNSDTCLFTAIRYDESVLRNPNSSMDEKLESLKFLGHWVGDIHQPLHVSFADDRGGNNLPLSHGIGCKNQLHSVWDQCIPEDLMQEMGISLSDPDNREKFGKALHASLPADMVDTWRSQMNLAEWADESFKITRSPKVFYCILNGRYCQYSTDDKMYWENNDGEGEVNNERVLSIDSDYEDKFNDIVKERLQKAGVRLGAMLNSIFIH